MRKIDLSGQTFENWLVLDASSPKSGETYWKCRCSCGKEIDVSAKALRRGKSRSCGCATKELHGRSNTDEYAIFRKMRQRCANPSSNDWRLYGGKGITVEWKTFDDFHRDMGDRPSPSHSIDRKDGNGPYSKENCRWATPQEQARNMHVNRLITFDGETRCLAEWADITGISRNCIEKRIDLLGWTISDALTVPVGGRR